MYGSSSYLGVESVDWLVTCKTYSTVSPTVSPTVFSTNVVCPAGSTSISACPCFAGYSNTLGFQSWTDSSTIIDSSAVSSYITAVNIGGSSVIVNGVTFSASTLSGTYFTILGIADWYYYNDKNTLTSNLARDFLYGGSKTISLKNLIIGRNYEVNMYSVGFEASGRMQKFNCEGVSADLDQDYYGSDMGIVISCRFTASATTASISITPWSGNTHFHLYALTIRDFVSTSLSSGNSPLILLACRQCAANTYSLAGSTVCSACPAISNSTAGANNCVCNSGYVQSGVGSSLSCSNCPLAVDYFDYAVSNWDVSTVFIWDRKLPLADMKTIAQAMADELSTTSSPNHASKSNVKSSDPTCSKNSSPENVGSIMFRIESINSSNNFKLYALGNREGKFLMIFICNFHLLSHLLLIYICKLHWMCEADDVCGIASTQSCDDNSNYLYQTAGEICNGKTSCTLYANITSTDEDLCNGRRKMLLVQASCYQPKSSSSNIQEFQFLGSPNMLFYFRYQMANSAISQYKDSYPFCNLPRGHVLAPEVIGVCNIISVTRPTVSYDITTSVLQLSWSILAYQTGTSSGNEWVLKNFIAYFINRLKPVNVF